MKILQESWDETNKWTTVYSKGDVTAASVVFCFGHKRLISDEQLIEQIKSKYSGAEILLNSSSGEIQDSEVLTDKVVLTAIEFAHTTVKTFHLNIKDYPTGFEAGRELTAQIPTENLCHLFIISDGRLVNGSELVRGINEGKPSAIPATGGMAGDGFKYMETLVGINAVPRQGEIAALAFYGDRLKVGYGSEGGWNTFGPERIITKSSGNVLYELDGISALDLYKKYLGDEARQLPVSAFYFPLAIKEHQELVVRGVLAVNDEDNSMTFAGDLKEGATVQMMIHNTFNLIDGAEAAAKQSINAFPDPANPEVAILVSCVGRKIVMGQYIDSEIEVIRELYGKHTAITGFYSYGEIAPLQNASKCELHNLTMTITTFSEI